MPRVLTRRFLSRVDGFVGPEPTFQVNSGLVPVDSRDLPQKDGHNCRDRATRIRNSQRLWGTQFEFAFRLTEQSMTRHIQ